MIDHPNAGSIEIKALDAHFIGGEWRRPSHSASIDVVSPANARLVGTVAAALPEDIDKAVAAAKHAFYQGEWPRTSATERATLLKRIAANLRSRLTETAVATTIEMGAPLTETTAISSWAADVFDFYASVLEEYPLEQTRPRANGELALILKEPVGVVAAIIPWNAPALLAAFKVAPALAAGCTVILKAAPETPYDSYILAECIEAAGLPPGAFNFLTADREASDHLVRHAHVDKVSFTGSTAVGKRILAAASERVGRVSLELGGKSAAIVLEDADPDIVANSMALEVSINCGQVCAALSRLLVPCHLATEYEERLRAAVIAKKVGDPFDPDTRIGPLAMERQWQRVRSFVAKGSAEGAKLVMGGETPSDLSEGYYIDPVIFAGVSAEMTIAREEIFGPVLSIIPYDSPDEAIRIANDSDYGLHGSVFTADSAAALAVARQIRTGSIGHNGRMIDWQMPFGGFKQSGLGREGGVEGLEQYFETKTFLYAS